MGLRVCRLGIVCMHVGREAGRQDVNEFGQGKAREEGRVG